MTAHEYVRTRDCATEGCERHTREGGDAVLERISPKGLGCLFVGLCQDHYGKTVVLKSEAAKIMEGAPV
jgi:hypothetical protein